MNELQKHTLDVLIEFDNICLNHSIKYSIFGGTFLGAIRHQGYIPWDDDVDIVVTREAFEKLDKVLKNKGSLSKEFYYQSFDNSKRYLNTTGKLRSTSLNVEERIPKVQDRYFGPWVDIFIYDKIPENEDEQRKYFKKIKRIDTLLFILIFVQRNPNHKGIGNTMRGIVQKFNEMFYKLYFFIPSLIKYRDKLTRIYNDTDSKLYGVNNYMFYRDFNDFKSQTIKEEDMLDLVQYNFESKKFWGYKNYDRVLTTLYNDYMTLPPEADRVTHSINMFE